MRLLFWFATGLALLGCGGRADDEAGSMSMEPPATAGSAGSGPATGGAGASVGGAGSSGSEGPTTAPQGGAATDFYAQAARPCGVPGDVIRVDTREAFEARLFRQWVYCSGAQLQGIAHEGLEFEAGGLWFFLAFDADGAFVRQKGFDGGGNWSISEIPDNGPGFSFQLNIDGSRGGTGAFPMFQDAPEAIRFSTMSGPMDYVVYTPE